MDPAAAASAAGLINELWKVGGAVAFLILLLALVLWFFLKSIEKRNAESIEREKRMAAALDACQTKHDNLSAASTTALVKVTGAIEKLDETNGQICQALRARPCLTDPTPIQAHRTPLPGTGR